MFWWEMCGEERDLVASGNGVYGGGGPTAVAGVAGVVVVVVVGTAELRGGTAGGANANGVKRKGPLGKAAAVVEDARLRGCVLWPDDDARLRAAGVMTLLRG
jgi:hypothetical protein